jgi:LuxR family maltose regulon positive regulatory protein
VLAAAYAALDEFAAARRHRDAAPHEDDGEIPTDAYSAWLYYREGHLEQAVGHANRLLEHDTLPWRWATPLAARGGALRERNQLDAAALDLGRAMELADQWWRPPVFVFAAIEMALLRFAQGSTAEAFDLLAEAQTRAHGVTLRQRLDAVDAALWLRAGDVERATALRRELPAGGRLTALLDARLLRAQGEVERSLHQIDAAEAGARSLQDRIGAHLLRARVLVPDDESAAMGELHRAIDLGRWEGFVQLFTEDLVDLEGMLRSWLGEGDDPYAFGLLAAVADRGRRRAPALDPAARPVVAEALSSRERVVLHYLATSLANKEIAGELHMSVNTLKTHLKSIYRKLGARTRQAAVSSARQQRLL